MADAKWDGQRWRIRITRNGKTRSFSSSTPGRRGKAEVLEKARKFSKLTDLCTFGEAWTRYLDELEHITGPEHYRNIESVGRNYLLPKLQDEKLVDLTTYDYQSIIFKLKKRNGEPMAKKSLGNVRGAIINFSKFCVRAGLLDDQIRDLRLPRDAHKVGKEILQPDQAKRLFTEFEDNWYIYLFRFLLATGCRPGEAHGLRWEDIHDGMVFITRAYNYQGRMTEGKNENARRCFALNSILNEILQKQKERTWMFNSEYVFCNHAGKAPRQTDTIHYWDAIRNALGCRVSPYGLRHTFVSYMAQTLPEMALKDLLGHSISMQTYSVYKHAVNGQAQRTADQVNITLLKTME